MTEPVSPTGPDQGSGESSRTSSLQIGSILAGRYRIVGTLGDGAMGSVYLGEHLKIGRKDAIKVLRDSLATDKEAMARFVRGARSVSRIRHENVCTIYDFSDTSEGVQFLAMEYIPGTTLRELLVQQGTLPIERVLSITLQVAGALQAAHDAGIVHRDLKPANIMLMPGKGGADVVKVVDFDIAKAEDDTTETEVTRFGFVVGTPEYMSPEQLTGERLDGRSDIYSLALVVYRMLTGLLPFPVENTREMLVSRLTRSPLSLEETLPGKNHPRGLQQVLDWALQRNPDERAPSCAAFAKAFRDAVVAAGVAPPSTRSFDVVSTRPPHTQMADVPATRVADASMGLPDPRGRNAPTGGTAIGNKKLAYFAAAAALIIGLGAGAWALTKGSGSDGADATGPNDGGTPPLPGNRTDPRVATVTDSTGTPGATPGAPSGQQAGNTSTPATPAGGGNTGGRSDTGGRGNPPPVQTYSNPTENAFQVDTIAIKRQSGVLAQMAFDLSNGNQPDPAALRAIRDTAMAGFQQASGPRQRMLASFAMASALYHLKQFDRGLEWAVRARDLCEQNPGIAPNCKQYELLVDTYQNRAP